MSTREPSTLTTGTLRVQRMPRWFTGRSELFVAAAVIVLAVSMTIGVVTMEVPDGTAFPGPQFFPIIVTIFLYGVGLALAIVVMASPRRVHATGETTEVSTEMLEDLGSLDETSEIRVVSPADMMAALESGRGEGAPPAADAVAQGPVGVDWKTLGITVAAIAGFIVVLPVVGWLISAAALFWVLAWAFGSTRPLFDIGLAVIISSVVQLAFGLGLGLSLPAGIMEGLFPWIS